LRLLQVAASLGYRVIGLEYNDFPAVNPVCRGFASPSCFGHFRQERVFGNDSSAIVFNPSAESIVNRLIKLLIYLREHDDRTIWGSYIIDGRPNWSRIVLSGFSQGAGMAAFIAKQQSVARVVLFSSPWDVVRPSGSPAPWIFAHSATPPERWFAEYHRRENMAKALARVYEGLDIPTSNIRILDLDLPKGFSVRGDNPYHSSTTKVPAYAPEWAFLFGKSP
jgi:hypothetical protein